MITKKAFLASGLFFFILLSFYSTGLADDLATVRSAIQSRGAKWISGETSVSRLSLEQKRMRSGLIKPTHTEGRAVLSRHEVEPLTGLPSSLDWRNNGGNFVSGIRNQGGCGDCWAFATTAALESSLLRAGVPAAGLDLSEQVMVSCGNSGGCGGGYISYASDYIRDTGLPNEACYPYGATDGSCSNRCPDWQSTARKIAGWSWVTTTSTAVDTLKNALYTQGPLVTTMDVYGDFYYYTGGVYTHTSGSILGGHAVLLVGYNDAGQYFIVKNSWGTGWGEQGYFKIAYNEVNGVVNFGDWSIAYQPAGPTCSYTLSGTSVSVDDPGATGSVNVTTSGGTCTWTASSNATWISITSGASGTGNGTVYYTASTNTGNDPRTGSITIAGQTFTITQEGQGCSFMVKQVFPASGGTGSLRVSAVSGCAWQSATTDPWITITNGQSGTGSGKVSFSVSANSGAATREGTLTVAGTAWPVFQEAAAQTCTFAISPTSQSFTAGAGTGSVSVTAATGCAWQASSGVSWISITSGTSGTGNGTVYYSVAANTGTSSRNGTMTIAGQTLTVTQAGQNNGGPHISVNPASLAFGTVAFGDSSTKTLTITNTGGASLIIGRLQIYYTAANQFRRYTYCNVVAPGGFCTIDVTYSPSILGPDTASVHIPSNDPDTPELVVTLSGTGI
jgi:C1A family cysteine protease